MARYVSDGSRVRIEGERGGFTYITFLSGPNEGITCKVPPSWVDDDGLCDECGEGEGEHDRACFTGLDEEQRIFELAWG